MSDWHKRTLKVLPIHIAVVVMIVFASNHNQQQTDNPEITELARDKMEYKISWPEIFINPDFEYPPNTPREVVLADGLEGWGCSYMEMRPETFGQGMAKIRVILGTALPEDLLEMAKEP